MATYTYVNIDLPEAKRLADLSGIFNDLCSCQEYCRRYIKGHPNHPDLECYWTTLITKYTRCFREDSKRGQVLSL